MKARARSTDKVRSNDAQRTRLRLLASAGCFQERDPLGLPIAVRFGQPPSPVGLGRGAS